MKKTRKKRRGLIVISMLVAIVLIAGAVASYLLFADRTKAIDERFARQPLVDYTQFLPKQAINKMFDDKGGFAYLLDAEIYYADGEYKTSSVAACISENDVLYIQVPEYGKKTPEELATILQCNYVVYDSKLVIFSYKDDFVNTFEDVYTLEALAMYLRGAGEADIANAFITLPNFVSNDANNSIYYTEPNLNLGLQTQIYSLQMEGYDTGFEQVADGPMIVAGQGRDEHNNTVVRVFNAQQTCISQFLAYPSKVKGGVDVKAGKIPGSEDVLIVTAPYTADVNAALSIKVFDSMGSLYYGFVPDGIEAPYAIEVGNFTGRADEMCIFVTSREFTAGKTKCALYNLADGSYIDRVTPKDVDKLPAQNITVSTFSDDADLVKQQLIFSFDSTGDVYYLNCIDKSWTKAEFTLPENVTAVYDSAFPGQLIASITGDTFSEMIVYAQHGADIENGTILNVGKKENIFYSTYAEKNDDAYVTYGKFNHIRTDLDSRAVTKVSFLSSQKRNNIDLYWDSLSYSDWKYNFTPTQAELYHSTNNMWEPCFTHRWNKISSTIVLSKIVDKETGFPAYVSVGRDNKGGDYVELESSFLIGTYADAIPEMQKMRIYPLRTMLQQLAGHFRGENGEPEKLIAVSPVHEQEINVAGSIGDYHPNMIKGFREYLLGLYGSVENINKRFGTNFDSKDKIDPPRYDPKGSNLQECRGDWDVYGESDYFTQWSLYTRNIVNKRILEAYREALLAGFPPEAINAHQIPEGDAVGGFLGEADTRLSPTDVVSICGTAYGGTRYGIFYNRESNFLSLSYASGHYNTTLGEYSSLASSSLDAYEQLLYLRDSGVKFTHVLVPYDSESPEYKIVKKAETSAVSMLQKENDPRTASTGGTGAAHPVYRGTSSFDIVQLGDADLNGLLKSVKQDGSWEGSVYLVPFRSQIEVTDIDMKGFGKSYTSDVIKGLQYGDQVELTFMASYKGSGKAKAKIEIFHAGNLVKDATCVYTLNEETTPYRYVLSNQLRLEDIEIRLTFDCNSFLRLNVDNIECTSQIECAAHKYFGDLTAAANKGGVSFDIID